MIDRLKNTKTQLQNADNKAAQDVKERVMMLIRQSKLPQDSREHYLKQINPILFLQQGSQLNVAIDRLTGLIDVVIEELEIMDEKSHKRAAANMPIMG